MSVHNRLLLKYRRSLGMINTIKNTVDGDGIKRNVKVKAVLQGDLCKQVCTFNKSWLVNERYLDRKDFKRC